MSDGYDAFNSWKPLLYREKCEAIVRGKFESPVIVHIYPTNRCNSDCRFCIMATEKRRGGELGEEVFRKAIESCNAMAVKSIHVSGGGEPLLYPHLDHLAQFGGLKVLSTNGAFLAAKHVHLFDRIRVSLNAGSAKTHKELTGLDNWDTLIENIRVALRVGKETGKTIGFGFLVDWRNWKEVYNYCVMASDLDVDFVHIRPVCYPKDSQEDRRVREVMSAAHHLVEAAKHDSRAPIFWLSHKFEGYWTPRRFERCLATPLQAVITATAELAVCQDVFLRYGDLKKQKLEEVWGGDRHKEAIRRINVDDCPRCVLNGANEIMEHVFVKNTIVSELL